MILLPAIDLFQGQAVRLYQGDYEKMTVYDAKGEQAAQRFVKAGCGYVHVVDLEGARCGSPRNIETIRKIAQTGLKMEVGGGLRSLESVEKVLEAGASRVILGTAALEDPSFLQESLLRYGDRIAVGVDLRGGYVAVRGWRADSEVTSRSFLSELADLGVSCIIVTDISRDGAMKGPNLPLYASLMHDFSFQLIASGGISSVEDLKALAKIGVYGAIVGKACYTGAIDLKEAQKALC